MPVVTLDNLRASGIQIQQPAQQPAPAAHTGGVPHFVTQAALNAHNAAAAAHNAANMHPNPVVAASEEEKEMMPREKV